MIIGTTVNGTDEATGGSGTSTPKVAEPEPEPVTEVVIIDDDKEDSVERDQKRHRRWDDKDLSCRLDFTLIVNVCISDLEAGHAADRLITRDTVAPDPGQSRGTNRKGRNRTERGDTSRKSRLPGDTTVDLLRIGRILGPGRDHDLGHGVGLGQRGGTEKSLDAIKGGLD